MEDLIPVEILDEMKNFVKLANELRSFTLWDELIASEKRLKELMGSYESKK